MTAVVELAGPRGERAAFVLSAAIVRRHWRRGAVDCGEFALAEQRFADSYTADSGNRTMKLIGSNFQSGDTLTFTDPEGAGIAATRPS